MLVCVCQERWSRSASHLPGLPLTPFLLSAILSVPVKSLTRLRGGRPGASVLPGVTSGSSSFSPPPGTSLPFGSQVSSCPHHPGLWGCAQRPLGGMLRPRPPSPPISFFLVRTLLHFSPGSEAFPGGGRMTWRAQLAAGLSTQRSASGCRLLATSPEQAGRAFRSPAVNALFCFPEGYPASTLSHHSPPDPRSRVGILLIAPLPSKPVHKAW